jgi:hypothetical protein
MWYKDAFQGCKASLRRSRAGLEGSPAWSHMDGHMDGYESVSLRRCAQARANGAIRVCVCGLVLSLRC